MIIISHQERIIQPGGRDRRDRRRPAIAHRGTTEEIFPLILADTLGGCPVTGEKGGVTL